jgi:arabinan endo-1,5-alpha-L-arabinosidase
VKKDIHFRLISILRTALIAVLPITFLDCSQAQVTMVHDPVLIQQADTFYLFCTGPGISQFTSTDLKHWNFRGPVLTQIPEWTHEHVVDFKGHIWAPDICFYEGTYYLYYSVSSFAKNTSCIGLLTNTTLDRFHPAYDWTDQGIVVESVPGRDLWNAIDPNLIVDTNGEAWLSFGSFWEGIKLVKLNKKLNAPAKPEEWHTIARRERSFTLPDEQPGDGAVEAPFIYYRNGYYYLFVSFDYCCRGKDSNYKIVTGRSENITGPYLDRDGKDMFHGGGTLLLAGNANYAGLGHNAVFHLNGADYLVYHAYDMQYDGKAILKIQELSWDQQKWPKVERK